MFRQISLVKLQKHKEYETCHFDNCLIIENRKYSILHRKILYVFFKRFVIYNVHYSL